MEEVESLLIKAVSIIYAGIKSKTLWNGNHSRVLFYAGAMSVSICVALNDLFRAIFAFEVMV